MSTLTNASDADLLTGIRNSDPVAFKSLYDRYWERLYKKAKARLMDRSDAQECIQELFAQIWKRREHLQIKCLEAYLLVSLRNEVLNMQQKRHRLNRQVAGGDYQVDVTSENSCFAADFLIRQREAKKLLSDFVGSLPPQRLRIYELCQEGYSHKEVSIKLNIAEKTVSNQMTTVKAKLRSIIFRTTSAAFAIVFSMFFV